MNRCFIQPGASIVLMPPSSIYAKWKPRRKDPEAYRSHIIAAETFSVSKKLFMPTTSRRIRSVVHHSACTEVENNVPTRISVRGNVNAGGVLLDEMHTGLGFVLADAPALVLSDPVTKRVVGARCSLQSLVDHKRMCNGKKPRKHFSVVDACVQALTCGDVQSNISDLHAGVYCGIGPEHFAYPPDHPKFGEQNQVFLKKLKKEYSERHQHILPKLNGSRGNINLFELIAAQLEQYGMHRKRITKDDVDTGSNNDFASVRTESKRKGSEKKRERNFVLIRLVEKGEGRI